jgi:hypothetical protein
MSRPSFPAVIIAPLLLVVCYFPGERWLAYCFPGLSGRATVDAGLNIFDIPVRLPFPIDLILVPALFIILYSTAILIFSRAPASSAPASPARASSASGSPAPASPAPARWQILAHHFKAVVASTLLILVSVAIGGLISFLVRDHLPAQVRNSITSLAVNADLHLPYAGYTTIPFRGDVFSFLGLTVALVIGIRILNKTPRIKVRNRLTREQLMTPYQRMLLERRYGTPRQPAPLSTRPRQPEPLNPPLSQPPRRNGTSPRHYEPSHGLCRNEPLLTLQPEAVNFRPLG